MPDLGQTLIKIRGGIRDGNIADEDDVIQTIVQPLFQALEWDVFDKSQFEWRKRNRVGQRPDIRLKVDGKTIILEAKSLKENLDHWVDKVLEYARKETPPVQHIILTNGREWRFYLPFFIGTPEEQLVARINLEETRESTAKVFEGLLQRPALLKGHLEKNWCDLHASNPSHEERNVLLRILQDITCDSRLANLIAAQANERLGRRISLAKIQQFVSEHLQVIEQTRGRTSSVRTAVQEQRIAAREKILRELYPFWSVK